MTRFFSELCFVEGDDGTLELLGAEPATPEASST
jgi:hypothetical protein